MSTPEIHKTHDYTVFNFADFNRELNRANINKLKQENEKEDSFKYFPILVDKNLTIIDGQHRFTAAREMSKPIYYIIKDCEIDHHQIKIVNTAGRPHTKLDYYEMAKKMGNTDALYVDMLVNEYNINKSAALMLCYGADNGNSRSDARKGIFLRIKPDLCEQYVKMLEDICEHQIKTPIVSAVYRLSASSKITPLKILVECKRGGLNIGTGDNMMAIQNKIVKTFNYGKRKENRIS